MKPGMLHFSPLFGLVPAPCALWRWTAVEADEDPPPTVGGRTEAKTLWFKSSAASGERGCACCACRRPALSGSTDEGPAT